VKTVIAIIHRWHWGKLVILWSWGGVLSALLLTNFLSTPPRQHIAQSLATFLGALAIVTALTMVTWVWLGGKELGGKRSSR
jgi:hypothetical protein